MNSFFFTPETELDLSDGVPLVAVKGQLPQSDFSVFLKDIYFSTPSLDPSEAYKIICQELMYANALLVKHELRESIDFPNAESREQAINYLNVLFSPFIYGVRNLGKSLISKSTGPHEFLLENPLPFTLSAAKPSKLIHTLGWIDTNIKVTTENILKSFNFSTNSIARVVINVFKIYSLLLKQQDYKLANLINFNHSMFLQDRILNLIFGDDIYLLTPPTNNKGIIANEVVLSLLKGIGDISIQQMCSLSVFMGIVWTSKESLQNLFLENANLALSQVQMEVETLNDNWCINQTEYFLNEIGADPNENITVILDDNGEAVIDIALFQKLLNNTGNLRITFIVNRYSISNNISLETFNRLLNDEYFSELKTHILSGRVAICIEDQVFRSFESEYLNNKTQEVINNSLFTYIKGANFFETLQILEIARYYCFTCHSYTSQLLTGCSKGKGIFVRMNPGQMAYSFHNYQNYRTLTDITTPIQGAQYG